MLLNRRMSVEGDRPESVSIRFLEQNELMYGPMSSCSYDIEYASGGPDIFR